RAVQGCGTCEAPPVAGTSGCSVNADCGDRQTCVASLCQSYRALNAACSAQEPCGEELACVGGICKQDGASVGIVCDATAATQPPCDLDLSLYCASGMCAVVAAASAQGQCGLLSGVRTLCSDGSDCYGGICK